MAAVFIVRDDEMGCDTTGCELLESLPLPLRTRAFAICIVLQKAFVFIQR